MFAFRDKVNVAELFGRQLFEAVRRTSSRSKAHRDRLLESFLYDSPEGLSEMDSVLRYAHRTVRPASPQNDELLWALGQSGSLLVVRQACELHYMASEDEDYFEALTVDPSRLKLFLATFQGVSSRRSRPRLTLVNPI